MLFISLCCSYTWNNMLCSSSPGVFEKSNPPPTAESSRHHTVHWRLGYQHFMCFLIEKQLYILRRAKWWGSNLVPWCHYIFRQFHRSPTLLKLQGKRMPSTMILFRGDWIWISRLKLFTSNVVKLFSYQVWSILLTTMFVDYRNSSDVPICRLCKLQWNLAIWRWVLPAVCLYWDAVWYTQHISYGMLGFGQMLLKLKRC